MVSEEGERLREQGKWRTGLGGMVRLCEGKGRDSDWAWTQNAREGEWREDSSRH